jgi:hypothetical protein
MRFFKGVPSAGVLVLAAGVTVALAQGGVGGHVPGLSADSGSSAGVGGSNVGASGSGSANGRGATVDGTENLGDREAGTGDVVGTVTGPGTNGKARSSGAQAGGGVESEGNLPSNAPGGTERVRR